MQWLHRLSLPWGLALLKQTHREWTYGYQGGEVWGEGRVREFGTDMYTLLYLEWVTNRDLLCSTRNSSQSYVAPRTRGEFGENGCVCVYVCVCIYIYIYIYIYGSMALLCTWNYHKLLIGCVCVISHSVMSDSVTPWTVAHQTPLSMEFSRQEYWSRLLFSSPGLYWRSTGCTVFFSSNWLYSNIK